MSQFSRFRGRIAVLATAAVAAIAFAAPTAASAASQSQTDWTLRASWVNYITNPLWAGSAPITTTWTSLGSNTYGIPVNASTSTATVRDHTGSIRFRVPLHGIDNTIANLEATVSGTDVSIRADVSYTPFLGTPVSDNREILTLDLTTAATSTPVTGGDLYADVPAILTAGGAQVFNGGSNGSYAAGQQFGDISIVVP